MAGPITALNAVTKAEKLALMTTVGVVDAFSTFSVRKVAVPDLLAQGKTLHEAANQLKISYRTSAHLVAQIKNTTNIANNAALITWAKEQGTAATWDLC